MKLKNNWLIFIFLAVLLLVLIIADLFSGSVHLSFKELIQFLFSDNKMTDARLAVFAGFRVPKVLTAMIAGAALAVSGLLMQTIFRNPLAGPYVLGVSAGASLGVALVVMGLGVFSFHSQLLIENQIPVVVAAWLGSGLVLLLILIVSSRIGNIVSVLILGILFNGIINSLINILQAISPENALKSFVVWTMGSLGTVTMQQLPLFSIVTVLGLILSYMFAPSLNLVLLGETYAKTSGLSVIRLRLMVFFITSVLAGTVTSFCGPIGFVGIVVPHIARTIFNTSDHRILIPASVLTGSVFMVASDFIATLPANGMILPINSITSITGIPFLIWIIFKGRNKM